MRDLKALTVSWLKAAGLACLAVYGPFVATALYTLLFVSCGHCKAAAWQTLPLAPGLVPCHLNLQWLGSDWQAGVNKLVLAGTYSLGMLAGATLLARFVRRGRWIGLAVVFAICSALAVLTHLLIRA